MGVVLKILWLFKDASTTKQTRPDQTHWWNVTVINQNYPIQAARLETRTCNHLITVSIYSTALWYRHVYSPSLKEKFYFYSHHIDILLRSLHNTEPLMSEMYILYGPCWDTSGRTTACSTAILYCNFNANQNCSYNLFTFQTYFTRHIRNIMQNNRYNTNINL